MDSTDPNLTTAPLPVYQTDFLSNMNPSTMSSSPVSSQTTSFFPLERLPYDAALPILNHLPRTTYIALTLTCKSYWTNLAGNGFIQRMDPPLTLGERVELGLMLERDCSDQSFFCHTCLRLCRFRPKDGNLDAYQPHECPQSPPENKRPEIAPWRWDTLKSGWGCWEDFNQIAAVPFHEARLVMRGHLYGKNFGLPIENLQHCYAFVRYPGPPLLGGLEGHFPLEQHLNSGSLRLTRDNAKNLSMPQPTPEIRRPKIASNSVFALPWRFKHEQTPRIINNELYMRRVHRVVAPSAVPLYMFITLVLQLELPICQHSRVIVEDKFWFLRGRWPRSSSREGPRLCGLDIPNAPHIKELYSCAACFTDCVLSVHKCRSSPDFWKLELTTYHRLGPCQTPESPEWLWLTTTAFYDRDDRGLLTTHRTRLTSYCYSNTFRAGDVRNHWLQSEGLRGDDVDLSHARGDTRSAQVDFREDRGFRRPTFLRNGH